MKCFPPLDNGWTNAHGSDKIASICCRLKKKVLAKKDAGVVDQGAGAVEDKDDQGGETGVAA